MNINLEYYKIFYYVGKLGGITLAAEELVISQPAVSQAVKQLERAVGMPLLARKGKGIRLTSAGEMLYSYVKRGYETLLAGERKLTDLSNLESGEIKIGASDMTLRFFLLPYLQQFHEKYPGIKLTVTNGPTPETLRYMQEGKIDFGVVTAPLNEKHDLKIREVRQVTDIFVAGTKFRQYQHRRLPLKLLEELPLICLEKNTSTRRYIDAFLEANQVTLHPEIELATSDMIVQFAERNLGVACVMEDFAAASLAAGTLFKLELAQPLPAREMYLITDNRNPMSAAAKELIEMISQKQT